MSPLLLVVACRSGHVEVVDPHQGGVHVVEVRPPLEVTLAAGIDGPLEHYEVAACARSPDEKPSGASPAHHAWVTGVDGAPLRCGFPARTPFGLYLLDVAAFAEAWEPSAARIEALRAYLDAAELGPEPPYVPFADATFSPITEVRRVQGWGGRGVLFRTRVLVDDLRQFPDADGPWIHVFQGLTDDDRQLLVGEVQGSLPSDAVTETFASVRLQPPTR